MMLHKLNDNKNEDLHFKINQSNETNSIENVKQDIINTFTILILI